LDYNESYSHNFAEITLEELGVLDVIRHSVFAPDLDIYRGTGRSVRKHIEDFLTARGWISDFKVDSVQRPSINFTDPDSNVLFQIQTGNIARAFYDLMKMQSIFEQRRCKCAVLCLPSATAAKALGSNIANMTRVREELEYLFESQIHVPVYLFSFE
jgi:hypothetical protein